MKTRFMLAIILTFNLLPVLGQPGGGGNPGSGNPVPISGIEILIGLGGLLGAKKVYDARKKR